MCVAITLFSLRAQLKLREAMERYETRLGCRRMIEVQADYGNLVAWLLEDTVARKYSWETVFQGKYPSMLEAPCLRGDPRMVIPVTVPAQRIYRDGKFYLQAPGPDFSVVECGRIFNDDTGFQTWVDTLAPWLARVSCTVGLVGFVCSLARFSRAEIAAAKQNKDAPWSAAVNRLLTASPPEAFVPKVQTQQSLPGPLFLAFRGNIRHGSTWLASAFQ
ncbi:unnamed protein product [Symbiodinium sp. CCMP2456]|nr:unnamed protein product [Symbiodinium sp. CCMP2456]